MKPAVRQQASQIPHSVGKRWRDQDGWAFPSAAVTASLFTLLLLSIYTPPCIAQGAPASGQVTSTGPLRFPSMHNQYPLLFTAEKHARPSFGFYVRAYPEEGENGGANSVSYLGWNPLGLDSTDAGIWLNFEHDYHGWFEHNMDVRTIYGGFARRMKTAVDRNYGIGVSKSWAFDHITLHHGRADAGGGDPQADFTLDPSPDFTALTVKGQILASRRIVSEAVVRQATAKVQIDWKSSNVIELRVESSTQVQFTNVLPGQHLTIVVRNPHGHALAWPSGLCWPDGNVPPAPRLLVRYGFLALEGMILADPPIIYN